MTPSEMTKIFIVVGETGEYSARRTWLVEARTSQQAAEDRIKRLEALMLELRINDPRASVPQSAFEVMASHPDGDPRFDNDYPSTRYY